MLERNGWFRALIVLLVVAVSLHIWGLLWDLLLRFGDIIMLFTLAWLVAFVLLPLAKALNANLHVPWALSVGTVYLLFFAGILALGIVLIPLLVAQLAELVVATPKWFQQLPEWYASIQGYLPEPLRAENLPAVLQQRDFIAPLQQLATSLLQNALGLATSIATALFAFVLVVIVSFYLTLDGDRIARGVLRLVPAEHQEGARFFSESVDRSFGGFLRGQLIQSFVYAAGTAIVMYVAGVKYVVLATTIAAIGMIIPFVGPFIAIVPPLLFAALQGSLSLVIGVAIALLVLQQLVFNVLAPKLMSQAVGIHPLLVFLAILIGGKAAGIAGAILGVPVAAVMAAMAGFFYQRAHPPEAPAEASPPTGAKEGPLAGLHVTYGRLLGRRSHKGTGG